MSMGAVENPPELWETKAAHLVEQWLREAETATKQLLQEHWQKVRELAVALLAQEVLFEEDLNKFRPPNASESSGGK